jgi:RNA polymerase sigma factor (sigma-70 family)
MAADDEHSARAEAAALFSSSLPLIDRAIARVCNQAGLRHADADDFASSVKLALIEDDYAILRAWQKRSALATYLTVVIQRLLSDDRMRARGRWEPSAAARRGGEAGILLETAVVRDARPLEQVLPLVQAIDPSLGRAECEAMLATFPERAPRPRQVSIDEEPGVIEVPAPKTADAPLLDRETARLSDQATAAVRRTLDSLPFEDRMIVRCRFGSGMSIADISRILRLPQRPLYRRLDALIARLRRDLVAAGIDGRSAESLIGSSVAALDFNLDPGKNGMAPQSKMEGGRT